MSKSTATEKHSVDTTEAQFTAFAEGSDTLFAALRSIRGRIAAGEGLSLSQARLMEPLEEHTPVTVSALARAAGVAVPTATRMLQGLEQRGMVTRRRAAHSDRVVEVLLTAQGAHALHNQQNVLRDRQRETFESLDDNEKAVALSLLTKLTALVKDL